MKVPTGKAGFLLAVITALAIVSATNGAFLALSGEWLTSGNQLRNFALDFLLIAPPFLLPAMFEVRKKGPWAVGIVLNLALWSWLVLDRLEPHGVNFLLGLMLLASPLVVSAACLATARLVKAPGV